MSDVWLSSKRVSWFYFYTLFFTLISRGLVSQAATCGYPGSGSNMITTFSDSSLEPGTFVSYACQEGYQLLGENSAACEESGTWTLSKPPVCVRDVALNRPVEQSSIKDGGLPILGNDGDTSTDAAHCVSTNDDGANTYWKIDLLETVSVYAVKILPKAGKPLSRVRIRVGMSSNLEENENCAWLGLVLPDQPILCRSALKGRYVSIHVNGPLSFCELQVLTTDGLPDSRCPVQSDSQNGVQVLTFENKCYKINTRSRLTFSQAQIQCNLNGGRLLEKVSPSTNTWLNETLTRVSKSKMAFRKQIWVGMQGRKENFGSAGNDLNWYWAEGDMFKTPVRQFFWAEAQPNNHDGEQTCAQMNGDKQWQWNDIKCDVEAYYICQYDAPSCGSPEIQLNTTTSEQSTGRDTIDINLNVGDEIAYSCAAQSKMIAGNELRSCLSMGKWSGKAPTCRYIDCGPLPPVENGVVFYPNSSTTYASLATHSCTGQLSLIGDGTFICDYDEQLGMDKWFGKMPKCSFVRCPLPEQPEFGAASLVDGHRMYRGRLQYTCIQNYTLIGLPERVCLETNQWTGDDPYCELKKCPVPLKIANADLSVGNITIGSTIEHICFNGYFMVGQSKSTCQMDQTWSGERPVCKPVNCGILEPIANGTLYLRENGTTFGKSVEYDCYNNFALVGKAVRTCLANATWEGAAPLCMVSHCPAPKVPDAGMMVNQNFSVGNSVKFVCDKGYRLLGDGVLYCNKDGYWVGNEPRCEYIDCGFPKKPPNGDYVLVNGSTSNSSLAEYRCNANYSLSRGERIVRCTETNDWSAGAPTCTGCGAPEVPEGGLFVGNNYSLNASVEYRCEFGYRMIGDRIRTCMLNSKWSGKPAKCELITCPSIRLPNNATEIKQKVFTVGVQPKVVCLAGNYLERFDGFICTDKGTWSGKAPQCLWSDCGAPPEIKNSRVEFDSKKTYYNEKAKYFCKIGYQLIGKSIAYCNESGQWQDVPRCVENEVEKQRHNVMMNKTAKLGIGIGVTIAVVIVLSLLIATGSWIRQI